MYAEKELKRELFEIKNFLTSLIGSIPAGIIAIDLTGVVIIANQQALNLLGKEISVNEIIDKKFQNYIQDIPELHETVASQIEKQRGDFIIPAITIAGESKKTYVSINGKVISNGLLFLITDITQMKKADEMKSEFVSLASHELKTPLGIMKWYLESIKDDNTFNQLPEQFKEYVDDIYTSNERMLVIVRDFLDVSRIDEGRVKDVPSQINVVKLMEEMIAELKPAIEKKALSVALQVRDKPMPEILIDPKRLSEVFQNVLSNGIKYNKENGKIDVVMSKKESTIQIDIIDTGIGIPKDDINKLFSKFFRASNAAKTETDGTGLGLYVVKSYMEGWGGKVAIRSAEGKGTCITLTIPLQPTKVS